jgi:hypothetical protein
MAVAELGSDDPALLASLSPSSRVDKLTTPLFVFATAGTLAEIDSQALVSKLREKKRTVEFMLGPEILDEQARETAGVRYARMARFLERTMSLTPR